MNDIPYSWGTAVNVQPMVFGNLNDNSGTGVAFTRDPATGEKKLFGEFLINAQGEDVVAGVRTPMPIAQLAEKYARGVRAVRRASANTLENHYRDMQDMEFTVENGKLYMLQTRNGKRTAAAALKIAVRPGGRGHDRRGGGRAARSSPSSWTPCCTRSSTPKALQGRQARSARAWPPLPALPAARSSSPPRTPRSGLSSGEKVVLVRLETSPEDIEGMDAAQGILTVRGGMTSHAAVVARGMGTCCVSGCGDIKMDEDDKKFELGGKTYPRGRLHLPRRLHRQHLRRGHPHRRGCHLRRLRPLHGAGPTSTARLKVRTNADTPARRRAGPSSFGAEGIGLCRTEHMFFEGDRIPRHPRDDRAPTPSRSAEGRSGQAAALSAGRLRGACTRLWKAAA